MKELIINIQKTLKEEYGIEKSKIAINFYLQKRDGDADAAILDILSKYLSAEEIDNIVWG
jgi:hypothetical protein